MLIDLHVQTRASTPGAPAPEKTIETAVGRGLGGIAFVDVRSSRDAKQLLALGEDAGLPVFIGVEIPTTRGRFLCFAPEIDPFMSREEWRQLMAVDLLPTYESVFRLFDGVGGAVLAAQPFERADSARLGDNLVFCDGLHGVEVFTAHSTYIERSLAVESAVKIGLPGVGGSRLASASEVGTAATLFATQPTTQEELVAALRAGDFWAAQVGGSNERPPRRSRPPRSEGDRDRGGRSDGDRKGGRGGRDRDRDRKGGRGGRGGDGRRRTRR